jgi:glycosyltransferase involved in cell wall biosynthesis
VRILTVVGDLAGYGGQERSSLAILAGLAQRGHEIDLVFVGDGDLHDDFAAVCVHMIEVPSVVVDPGRWRTAGTTALAWRRAARHLTKRPADVVYVSSLYQAAFGAALTRRRVGLACHLRLTPPKRRGLQVTVGARRADRFLAVSQHTADEHARWGIARDRIDVALQGVDLTHYRPDPAAGRRLRHGLGVAPGAYLVAYAGRLDRTKGVEVLLDAWRRLGLDPSEGCLVVAGAPRAHASAGAAKAFVRELHERAHGLRCEWVPRLEDVRPLYAAADVVVVPSPRQEPRARVAMEAMACGTPVLTSDVGGFPEAMGQEFASYMVPGGDPGALADALAGLRGWQAIRPELGDACRRHAECNFDVAHTIERVQRCLGRVRRFP